MKWIVSIAFLVSLLGCMSESTDLLLRSDYNHIDDLFELKYEAGNWQEMSYESPSRSAGNHRAVLETDQSAEITLVHFPWRRRDFEERKNGFLILNAISGDTIRNYKVLAANNDFVDLIFEPIGEGNQFHFYFYPFKTTGGYYPTVTYFDFESSSNIEWATEHATIDTSNLSKSRIVSVQSINEFNTFYPMELIATKEEVQEYESSTAGDYYLFPEYREYPIRMQKHLPLHWVKRGSKKGIRDEVRKGEYYVFQVGVYAPDSDLESLDLNFSSITNGNEEIPASNLTCFNLSGISLEGIPFTKEVNVEKGQVQPLWVGVQIPTDQQKGTYTGQVIIKPQNSHSDTLILKLDVTEEIAEDHGDNDPSKLSRLRWLNSTMGFEEEKVIPPFKPIIAEGKDLKILGRAIKISANGFPETIESFFDEEMTHITSEPEPILSAPMSFDVFSPGKLEWKTSDYEVDQTSNSMVTWNTTNRSRSLTMLVSGQLEYDGMMEFTIDLIAEENIDFNNIAFRIPMDQDAATYILGLGYKGGQRPEKVNWRWDITNHHEGVWLGAINKGLQFVLRDNKYERPLNTNFYQSKPLILPKAWDNNGKGGISVISSGDIALVDNYTGPGKMSEGDTLNFKIRFLITPFKPIDTKKHFNTRFVHKYVPVDSVVNWGGTVVNVHHANEINPYINYPFYNLDKQKAYVDEAHSKGIKVKLYNTIRELTYKSYEIFPMRSLGYEIFNDGEGGGHPWLQEHLQSNYHKAWHAWRVNDAAILNKGTSRWTNYYIEGLSWLARNQEIDGLYLDDIAFSRETVKRIVAVFSESRPDVIIDLHSANQFNPRDGFINSAFLYMEHFPYITRLWFGEYFEYKLGPDYWFTEVSGLPFGLMGEMLQDCGRPYRGLLYGMTTRLYGDCDPRPIWKLFNDFEIDESRMLGYWLTKPPIETGNSNVKGTAYVKDNEILIVLASWSEKDELIRLKPNWERLGLTNSGNFKWTTPQIEGLQSYNELDHSDITVPANQGLVVRIQAN